MRASDPSVGVRPQSHAGVGWAFWAAFWSTLVGLSVLFLTVLIRVPAYALVGFAAIVTSQALQATALSWLLWQHLVLSSCSARLSQLGKLVSVALGLVAGGVSVAALSDGMANSGLNTLALLVLVVLVLVPPFVAGRIYRSAVVAFATIWIVAGSIGWYSYVSRLEVEIRWAGPARETDRPAIYWVASSSGDFTVQLGGRACGDGHVVSSGRYFEGTADGSETFGDFMITEIPLDQLEADGVTIIRVCVTSGLARGSAERWVDNEGVAHPL